MGCGNPKEKVEDEMMKMKMARIELQMERHKQLQLLKKIDGCDMKTPNIPDYIDQNFLNDYISKKRNSESIININDIPKRTKRSKSFAIKRKLQNNVNPENPENPDQEIKTRRRNNSFKRKTMKL